MTLDQEPQRAIESIRLPLWGRVVASDATAPWLMVDVVGGQVEPVETFLRDFAARGRSAASVRS